MANKNTKKAIRKETFVYLWEMYLIGIVFTIIACKNVFVVMLEWIFRALDGQKKAK